MWWLIALDSNKSSRTAEWQLTSLTPTKGKQEEEILNIYLFVDLAKHPDSYYVSSIG